MISIVTVNLNNRIGLNKTFSSIKNQNNSFYELNVIDGDSTDGSLEIIKMNSGLIANLIIEKDSGVYSAMNKGVSLSKNNYLFFLNSGDSLLKADCLNYFYPFLGDFDLIYGNILDLGNFDANEVKYPNILSFEYMLCGGLPHQATVIRKSLFDSVGLYNENYKIISDWVFFMEALFIHNVSYKHIPMVITNFEGGGLSSLSANTKLIVKEQIDYILKRFPKSLFYYYSNSPYVKKYLRSKSRIIRWVFKYILIYFNRVI